MEESFPKSSSSIKKRENIASFIEMNTPKSNSNSNTTDSTNNWLSLDGKSIIIIFLVGFVLFPTMITGILVLLGNSVKSITDVFRPVILQLLKSFGYSAGTIINTTADVATDVSKTGIDIAGGSIKDVGNLFQGKTGPEVNNSRTIFSGDNIPDNLDSIIQKKVGEEVDKKVQDIDKKKKKHHTEYQPDSDDNNIQKPISSDKINWCLVGEYQNKRGCVSITESDQCLSGQIFPSKEMCLNPTLSP